MNKDWFSQLEERRVSVLFALLLIMFATLAVASMRDPMAYDSFWHLRMGQDWVEQDLSPFVDHYSFTHAGEEVHSPPYLFQALYYKTVDLLGVDAGYKILTFVALSLSTIMLLVWLRSVKAPIAVYLLALPMFVVLVLQRANVRPELFSYSFIILSLILYDKARVNPDVKRYLTITATMLVWVNYHSAVLGYVIFFGLFVDLAIDLFRQRAQIRAWVRWAAWGLVIVAVGFVNPDWSHPVIRQLLWSGEWLTLNREYLSPWQGLDGVIAGSLILISVTTVLMLVRQRLFGYAVICVIFTLYATQVIRMVVPGGIVVVCLFALALSRIDFHSITRQGPRARRLLTGTAWGVLFVVPLLAGVLEARERVKSNRSLMGYFPDQLVQYMKDTGKEGRIFNDYVLGGYLIYHLAPEVQVYIDGRTEILYPVERQKRWLNASTDANALISEIEEYDIDYVALSNRPAHIDLMGNVPNMHLDFADLRYSLYVNEDANFPAAGALWSKPACWEEGIEAQIQVEQRSALFLVPQYSLVLPILRFAAGYSGADDRAVFLRDQLEIDDESWSDPTLRIAGYRALGLGKHDLALNYLSRVQQPRLLDFLAMGMVNMRLRRFDEAEQMLQGALRLGRSGTDPHEFRLLHGLLSELNETRPLQRITQSNLDALTQLAEEQGIMLIDRPVIAGAFCDRER